jgi:hypothetical protein
MTEQEQAIAQHLVDIRKRAILLKERHDAATTKMMSFAPKPGSMPSRRARPKKSRGRAGPKFGGVVGDVVDHPAISVIRKIQRGQAAFGSDERITEPVVFMCRCPEICD